MPDLANLKILMLKERSAVGKCTVGTVAKSYSDFSILL